VASTPPNSLPSGCYLPVARLVKEYFAHEKVLSNAGLPVPVVGSWQAGDTPTWPNRLYATAQADMIMLARPLLADPDWPNKAYAGEVMDIRPCIGDQEGCLNELFEGGHIQCSVNPRTGFEDVFDFELTPTTQPKKVAVIGAGQPHPVCPHRRPRGHRVTLFERTGHVGGMLIRDPCLKSNMKLKNYLAYLEHTLEKTCKEYDLSLELNSEILPETLKHKGFDSVAVSVGGRAVTPNLPGINQNNIVQAIDLFREPELATRATNVLIIGAGSVGCEAAHFLTAELGKKVTIVEIAALCHARSVAMPIVAYNP